MDSVIVDYASKIESGLYSGSNNIAYFFHLVKVASYLKFQKL